MAGESVAALMEVLKPEETDLSTAVIAALGDFGPAAAPAVPKLLQTLKQAIAERNDWLAVWCAAALGRIAPNAPSSAEAIVVLERFTRHPVPARVSFSTRPRKPWAISARPPCPRSPA